NGLLCCFSETANSVTVYEADDNDLMGTVLLPSRPGCSVAPASGRFIFCALPSKNEVVAMDPAIPKVTATWSVHPGEGPSSIAYDSLSNHLLVGCSNKVLVTI